MSKTILFIPFDYDEDTEAYYSRYGMHTYVTKNNDWIQFLEVTAKDKGTETAKEKAKETYQVFYKPRRSSPMMRALGDDQVYIRGHSTSGRGEIFSGSGTTLDGAEVGRRLIETGLQSSFGGKLKCYNCWSGATGTASDFAQIFADYMWDKGYRSCRFYGYKGAVDSFPDANINEYRNAQNAKDLVGHKTVKTADGRFRRASDPEARVQIIPTQVKSRV
jgi:hypothetical protein